MQNLARLIDLFRPKGGAVKTTAVGVGIGSTVSALALAMALLIGPWEGNELKPYLDIGGIPTACGGVTGAVIDRAYLTGYVFTEDECTKLTMDAAAKHEKALRSVISDSVEPSIPNYTMAAFISWTYNVGPSAAATSTLVKNINAGQLKEACEQLPRWVKVKGKVINGLVKRRVEGDNERISERTLCLIGLDPSYKTPLFERLIMKVKP